MALCTRCGQHTETGEEFCAACGGYSPDSSPGSPYLAGAVSRGGSYYEAAGRARSSWFQPSVPDRGPQSRQEPATPAFRRDGFRYEQSTADPDPDEFWYEQPPRQASYHDSIRHSDSAAEDADWPFAADQRYRAAEPDSSASALPAEDPTFASRTAADWTAQPQPETPFPPQAGADWTAQPPPATPSLAGPGTDWTAQPSSEVPFPPQAAADWTAQPSSEVPPFLLPPAAEPAPRLYAPRPFRLDQAGTAVPRQWTGEEPGLGVADQGADPEASWHAAPAAGLTSYQPADYQPAAYQAAAYQPATFDPTEADTQRPAAIDSFDALAPSDTLVPPNRLVPPDTLVPPGLLRVTGAAGVHEAATREAGAYEAATREASAYEAATREASAYEAATREASAYEAATRKASAYEAPTRKASAYEAGVSGVGTLPDTGAWIAPADWTIAAVSGARGTRAPRAADPGTAAGLAAGSVADLAAGPAAGPAAGSIASRAAGTAASPELASATDEADRDDPAAREDAGPGAASLTGPPIATGLAPAVMPPVTGAQVPQRVRSGRWITMAAALVVVIIAAAVAVLAIAHHGASRPPKPAPTARHSARPSASPSAPAPITSGLVTVAPAAATAKHSAGVIAFLNRYFKAINSHDYPAYQRLFSAGLRGGLSAEAFASGYGTTHDSAVTLTGISSTGTGQLQAAVTFTSHQQPAASPTHSSCTDWTISLYLTAQDHHYKLATPPGSYAAADRACTS